MNFSVPLTLVAPCKFAATEITGKWLLACVRANVGGQMITTAEVPHAYPTLEWFVSSVDADMSGQFVRARETPIAALRRAWIGAFMYGGFARSVGVFSGSQYWPQGQVLGTVSRGQPRPISSRSTEGEVPNSVQRCQGRRYSERVEGAWERFAVRDALHVSLTSGLKVAGVVGDDRKHPRVCRWFRRGI